MSPSEHTRVAAGEDKIMQSPSRLCSLPPRTSVLIQYREPVCSVARLWINTTSGLSLCLIFLNLRMHIFLYSFEVVV